MNFSRRTFLKSTSVACSAAFLPTWVLQIEAAETAAVDKNALAEEALALAKKLGATYADIRINRYRNESIFTREQQVMNVSRNQEFGFGLRVLVKGAWGFAASHMVTSNSIKRITEQAIAIDKANALYHRKPIDLTGELGDSKTIVGAAGLLAYLGTQDKQVMTTLSRKMLGYALGRTVLASDRPLLAQMAAAGGNAAFSDLAVKIVTSRQFRTRAGDEPALSAGVR